MNKIGGAPEVFGGYANPAIISYLAKLDQSAADDSVDLSDLQDNVENISVLLEIARQDINAAEIDIVDLQQRMIDEEAISVDLQARMAAEEIISIDLQGRMAAEETITATHETEITTLQNEMIGQQLSIELAYKRIRLIEYPIVNNITGTVPLLVGQFVLPAGDYFSAKVNMGCSLPADTATLSIMDVASESELVSISRMGNPIWNVADDFTLTADTEVKLWLSADTITATAIIYCIKFEVF